MAAKTPRAPKAPAAKVALPVVPSGPSGPPDPTKKRKAGRPPTAKCNLHALKDAIAKKELDSLFWACAAALVDHTEYCKPGTRDYLVGLSSLTSLMRSKITKTESESAEDMAKIAATMNAWMPETAPRERPDIVLHT